MLASSRVISIFSSSSHEHSYTSASHAMLATCALQSTFRIIVCVTDALDDQTEAPFVAGLAASTEEHLPIFALSGSDVGKIVIGKARPVHWRTSAAPKSYPSKGKVFQPYGNLTSLKALKTASSWSAHSSGLTCPVILAHSNVLRPQRTGT